MNFRSEHWPTVLLACVPLLTTALSVRPSSAQEVEPPACTIVGTARGDRLIGTPGDDVICGLGGNDLILGNGGDDIIDGGPGQDTIRGGAGDDVLHGGEGNDILQGDGGRDLLLGEEGRDALNGGRQADQFIGGDGGDRITAGTAGDTCAEDDSDRVGGACASDTTPPLIADVDFPTEISSGSTLTVRWRVTDPSGVYEADGSPGTWMRLGGASGWVRWCDFTLAGTRVSGDSFDGVYETSCNIPADAVNGAYSLFFGASDPFGNASFTDGGEVFTVAGGSDDTDVPDVEGLSVTADAWVPGATVTLRWRASDATGVQYVIPWAIGPNGFFVDTSDPSRPLWLSLGVPTLVEGDAQDGLYEVALQLSANAVPGTYTLWLSLGDVLGNRTISDRANDGRPFGSFDVLP